MEKDIAKFIDYTNVSPIATSSDIKRLCQEAKKYGFFSVCVTSSRIKLAKSFIKNSSIKLISVVGFPHGTTIDQIKAAEAKQAVKNGADEIDMVMNIGAFKEKNYQYVLNEIKMVVQSAKPKLVKVIIETCYLTKNEIKKICQIVKSSGAVFVKTSTGYGPTGAKEEDIKLMRKTVGPNFGVKASGYIRDKETVLKMIKAGANRIGTRALLK